MYRLPGSYSLRTEEDVAIMPDASADHRTFRRYAADFNVTIVARQDSGDIIETVPLKDLSGGGLSFISRQAGRYRIGQQLVVIISLPHTEHAAAQMQGTATVVRIDRGPEAAVVGLRLASPLVFSGP